MKDIIRRDNCAYCLEIRNQRKISLNICHKLNNTVKGGGQRTQRTICLEKNVFSQLRGEFRHFHHQFAPE